MIRITNRIVLVAALTFSSLRVYAASETPDADSPPKPAIELGSPFVDNVILQRGMKVPVWGWSGPGTKVTVEFAGQKKTATTGGDGKWMLQLDALRANAAEHDTTSAGISPMPR